MTSIKAYIDELWGRALKLIEAYGWHRALPEIERSIITRKFISTDNGIELDEASKIVIGSLYQKFGMIDEAIQIFQRAKDSDIKEVENNANIKLSKLYSQKGHFKESLEYLKSIIKKNNLSKRSFDNSDLPQSFFWRIGFLSAMNNDYKSSEYWFDLHKERVLNIHNSQNANNRIFKGIISFSRNEFDADELHRSYLEGFNLFLLDGLSTADVKYVNISKAVLVPMIYDGLLLFKLGQKYDGIIQTLLCRRLMIWDKISLKAEGVGEAIQTLKKSNQSKLEISILERAEMGEDGFLGWFKSAIKDRMIFQRTIGECEDRFREFTLKRNYRVLFLANESSFPTVNRGQNRMKVFYFWDSNKAAGIELRSFLNEQCQCNILALEDTDYIGMTKSKAVEKILKETRKAIINISPKGNIYLGQAIERIGRENVIVLSTSPDDRRMELDLLYVSIDLIAVSKSFTKIRTLLTK